MLYELLTICLRLLFRGLFLYTLERTGGIVMGKKTKKKDEIVIINKFKDTGAESVTTTLAKVFEIFCNMQMSRR